MLLPGGCSPTVLHLRDIQQSIVEEDIKKYLKGAFMFMPSPPSDEYTEQLTRYTGGYTSMLLPLCNTSYPAKRPQT